MASGHGDSPTEGSRLRQLSIVCFLILAVILLHEFAGGRTIGEEGISFDPTGMLAFGFVVLASYTIGQLVEVIKLPHITVYLLA